MTVGPPGSPPGAGVPGEPASPGAGEPWWLPPVDREPTEAELFGAWPDPFAGPPDLQSWRERQAEADDQDDDDAAAGAGDLAGAFADGGPAEAMAPGPVLAAVSEDAVEAGLDQLSEDELVGVLQVARRLASWQAGVELLAVARLDARRRAQAERPGSSRVSEHVSAELAAALTLTGRSADELLWLARELGRMPAVRAALLAGRIDRARAHVFAAELGPLGDLAAAIVAAALAGPAGSLTTGQLRAELRAMVLMIDPGAVRRRAEQGREQARVESWPEGSGNCGLAGRELPPAEVIAADARLTAIARALKDAGAPGGLDQLRAAVFAALLTGRDPDTLLPAPAEPAASSPSRGGASTPPGGGMPRSHPDGATAGADDAGAPATDGDPAAGGGDPAAGGGDPAAGGGAPAAGAGDARGNSGPLACLSGSVHLTMPASAWLGLTDAPGEVTGHGPLDAWACRDLAARLAAGPATRWCLTLTGPDGRAAAHACARHGPAPPNLRQRGPEPAGTAGLARWLAGLPMTWLADGGCDHARQAPGYRPGPRLAHLIRIRQRTCSFPGCRRPARRCDLDHTIPYDQGGRTCECNLAPLCRAHHQAKQGPGWHVGQPRPGTLTWTTPHGRRYTTTPQPYPI